LILEEQTRIFSVQNEGETRLDKWLSARLPDLSRVRIQNLIKDGFVCVSGKLVTKTGQAVSPGQVIEIRIPPPEPSGLIPENIPLDILFENRDLAVINKPAGMVVHPSAGHAHGTLVHAALAVLPGLEGVGGEERPGVVHRLDKETSGLILMAKNDRAHRWLQDQFRLRKVVKQYLALVDGQPPTPSGKIDAPIGRDPSHRKKMAVLPVGKGREAITEYSSKEVFTHHTLIEAHPLTGRTHQIRLHLSMIGCPIVGDSIYGRKKASLPIDRHFLHAYRLCICLPGEEKDRIFEAPLPQDLQQILSDLRSQ
jgi:23S rRNA pseudouridine1911/1915/1917 synthase